MMSSSPMRNLKLFLFLLLAFQVPQFASARQAALDSKQLKSIQFEELSQKAPDLQFKDDQGKERKLSEFFNKNKFVLVHFWATWCSSCVQELPSLVHFQQKWKDDRIQLLVFSVDTEEKRPQIREFLSKNKIPLEASIVQPDNESKKYFAWGIPMTYLIDPKGQIIARALGERKWEQISTEKFSSLLTDYLSKTKK